MLTAFLNKPYPYYKDVKRNLLTYFFIGAFVSFFLICFQPFELSNWETPHKNLKLFGFGLISFIVPTVFSFLIPALVPAKTLDEGWTVLKEILVISAVLVAIAFGNLFYGRLLGVMPMTTYAYAIVFMFTGSIGIFPVSVHVMLKHNKLLKLNLERSRHMNTQLQVHEQKSVVATEQHTATEDVSAATLRFVAENEKDVFSIAASQLLFIASADNYSDIVFIENGKKKKQVFRSSLKRIESQLTVPSVMRCHRAYIVNLSNIKNIEGNAAGYKLFFYESEEAVPVSRNYTAAFNERLNALK